jgi:hypothetical protein
MKYHVVYASDYEKKVLEIDTDDLPPNIGDSVELPFGENKQLCQYRATDVFHTPVSQEKTIFFIEVKPV